jgi:hypothetical protein
MNRFAAIKPTQLKAGKASAGDRSDDGRVF